MTTRQAEVLLATIITARASSFLFSKLLLTHMGPFTLMGVRFLLAFCLLAVIFHKRLAHMTRRTFLHGLALGFCFFVVMAFELHALCFAATSTVSFLENTAIVLVPVAEALVLRRLPGRKVAASALMALSGVGLLTLTGSQASLGIGELLALDAALSYTAAMLLTDRFSKQDDPLTLGILQIGWMGALGLAAAVIVEQPTLPAEPIQWLYLAILVVVCSGFGFTLQPVAQRPLTSETTSLMCALNPLVATVLGMLVLGEHVSPAGIAGLALILLGILFATKVTSLPRPRPRRMPCSPRSATRAALPARRP